MRVPEREKRENGREKTLNAVVKRNIPEQTNKQKKKTLRLKVNKK